MLQQVTVLIPSGEDTATLPKRAKPFRLKGIWLKIITGGSVLQRSVFLTITYGGVVQVFASRSEDFAENVTWEFAWASGLSAWQAGDAGTEGRVMNLALPDWVLDSRFEAAVQVAGLDAADDLGDGVSFIIDELDEPELDEPEQPE